MINITATTVSSRIKDLMSQEDWSRLVNGVVQPFNLTIQNNGAEAIYIGRAGDVTVDTGYKLPNGSEVQIITKNPDDLRVITETADNDKIIVITT